MPTSTDKQLSAIRHKPREQRTMWEVEFLRRQGAVFGGCCGRFADNQGCDCLAVAFDSPNRGRGMAEFTSRDKDMEETRKIQKRMLSEMIKTEGDSVKEHSGSKYVRPIRSCVTRKVIGEIDVYSVCDAYQMPMPRSHAVKKLLCAGLRDKGTEIQDIKEAIDALKEDLKQLEADQ